MWVWAYVGIASEMAVLTNILIILVRKQTTAPTGTCDLEEVVKNQGRNEMAPWLALNKSLCSPHASGVLGPLEGIGWKWCGGPLGSYKALTQDERRNKGHIRVSVGTYPCAGQITEKVCRCHHTHLFGLKLDTGPPDAASDTRQKIWDKRTRDSKRPLRQPKLKSIVHNFRGF